MAMRGFALRAEDLVVRVVGVVASAALAVVLCSAVLRAESLSSNSGHADLGSALMLRLFGEVSDSNASFAAAFGDRTSESPLREMALHVGSAPSKVAYNGSTPSAVGFSPAQVALHDLSANDVSYLAQAANAGLLRSDAHFAAPATPSTAGTLPARAERALHRGLPAGRAVAEHLARARNAGLRCAGYFFDRFRRPQPATGSRRLRRSCGGRIDANAAALARRYRV